MSGPDEPASTARQKTGSFNSLIAPAINCPSSGSSIGDKKPGQRAAKIKVTKDIINIRFDDKKFWSLLVGVLGNIRGEKAKKMRIIKVNITDSL
ncbi:hypothetical protein H0901_22745 [Microcystis aeruginosa BLCCF158]|uniref:Uncharacterized protein n=1 Tax=Microcystis aeruginosa BLCC-F158 TaxID=2755316 RepID=A0A841VA42_MICAE|nr:hypothetical protein [Microcystis aeruginosa BLCC-F158]